jgi:two-component sensor histidine kinase
MIQVTETTPFVLQATSMNNALMLGSVRQHELTGAAEEQNAQLEAEIAERKRMERELRESEKNLSALLAEKEVLAREIHHRVKNNLQVIASLLSLQAGQSDDPRVANALSEAGGRVRAIGQLHETLYASSNLAEVNFGEYIQQLTDELQRLYGRPEISMSVSSDDIVLGMDIAVPLGLIANELILNCFKHAFPPGREGRVTVTAEYLRDSVHPGESLDDDSIRLRVRDNGTGLPPGFQASNTKSLGLRIVNLLGRQLRAEIKATTDAGLSFTVTVPSPEQSYRADGT